MLGFVTSTQPTFLGIKLLWHNLGKVEGSSAPLKILAGNELTLVEMGVVEMKDCYFNAIERRMHS